MFISKYFEPNEHLIIFFESLKYFLTWIEVCMHNWNHQMYHFNSEEEDPSSGYTL